MNDPEPAYEYDVLVIGAGPAGCEAGMAAADAGARTLCLTINLDSVGYPPATPELINGRDDRRVDLFHEFVNLGGRMPLALERDGVTAEREAGGKLIVDRRQLGLAYKEMLESFSPGLHLRQALATSLKLSDGGGWVVHTRLGESFRAAIVIVAAGTFLHGRVEDGGVITPGGRTGEIPSNSLAECLQNMDISLVEVKGTTMPRVDRRTVDLRPDYSVEEKHRLIPDGSELREVLAYDYRCPGNREKQLGTIETEPELPRAWITRPSYTVHHHVLCGNQVDTYLRSLRHDRLFFAGRAAGSCNYLEAATLGLLAGRQAAACFGGEPPTDLTKDTKFAKELCSRIASREERPVTVRIDEPGC